MKKTLKIDIFMIIKYLVSLTTPIIVCVRMKCFGYVIAGYLELLLIFLATNILIKRNKKIGYISNSILIFIFNIEELVVFFGSSFVTYVMLSNLSSLKDLSGNMLVYLPFFIVLIVISFLPVRAINYKINNSLLIGVCLAIASLFTVTFGTIYSPACSIVDLCEQFRNQIMLSAEVGELVDLEEFHHDEITNGIAKDAVLVENPNIILIFVEGLSYNIVTDERNIMPNVSSFLSESISFENYYNHTFATYRGLIGQLYSGYQLENNDHNNLISLQSILQKKGYTTTFINTEPKNIEFSNYVDQLGFDEVINPKVLDGNIDTVSDQMVLECITELIKTKKSPFLISVYTYGTHVTNDSVYAMYGDGEDHLLNRFYDFDCQFGVFLETFKSSDAFDNSILILTTDHCTYSDSDYVASFGNTRSNCDLDQIPLGIYYKGCSSHVIDVQGKNSLSLAPTILDMLDISEENYFLGDSLYVDNDDNVLNTIFYDPSYLKSTKNGIISDVSEEEKNTILKLIKSYCSYAR